MTLVVWRSLWRVLLTPPAVVCTSWLVRWLLPAIRAVLVALSNSFRVSFRCVSSSGSIHVIPVLSLFIVPFYFHTLHSGSHGTFQDSPWHPPCGNSSHLISGISDPWIHVSLNSLTLARCTTGSSISLSVTEQPRKEKTGYTYLMYLVSSSNRSAHISDADNKYPTHAKTFRSGFWFDRRYNDYK